MGRPELVPKSPRNRANTVTPGPWARRTQQSLTADGVWGYHLELWA